MKQINIWRGFLVALVMCLSWASDARAEQKYIVQGGVFEGAVLCPAFYGYPCEGRYYGPIKGVRVTIRTEGGQLKIRLRTNSKGYFRTRLPNGEYVASIRLAGYSQAFAVKGARIEIPGFTVGQARVR